MDNLPRSAGAVKQALAEAACLFFGGAYLRLSGNEDGKDVRCVGKGRFPLNGCSLPAKTIKEWLSE